MWEIKTITIALTMTHINSRKISFEEQCVLLNALSAQQDREQQTITVRVYEIFSDYPNWFRMPLNAFELPRNSTGMNGVDIKRANRKIVVVIHKT